MTSSDSASVNPIVIEPRRPRDDEPTLRDDVTLQDVNDDDDDEDRR